MTNKNEFAGHLRAITHCWKCGTAVVEIPAIGTCCPNRDCDVADGTGLDQAGLVRLNASIARLSREFDLRRQINQRLERMSEASLKTLLEFLPHTAEAR